MAQGTKRDEKLFRAHKEGYDQGFADGQRQTIITETFIPPAYAAAHETCQKVTELMSRDDGWLRVVPEENGEIVWVKWKFTSGKWAGHYVLFKGEHYPNAAAFLIGIHLKLVYVYLGMLKPSKDRYHDA